VAQVKVIIQVYDPEQAKIEQEIRGLDFIPTSIP
jgi:hypothetical protein